MYPSENPNDYADYRALKWQLAIEAFNAEIRAEAHPLINPLMCGLEYALQKLWNWVKKIVSLFGNFIRHIYGKTNNQKLIRLALYAKKQRTRKKNIHQILKILSK